jgi:hypothetical protein
MTPEQREELKAKMQGYLANPAEPRSCNPAAILSLIAQVEALTVPQGWKVVPIEPTTEMCDAAAESLWGYTRAEAEAWAKVDKFESRAESGRGAYVAMLDAIPTIPAIPGTKEITS